MSGVLPCGHRVARRKRRIGAIAVLLGVIGSPSPGLGQTVRITKLSDLSFGTITNLAIDARLSESVCVYSNSTTKGYNVTATGSGAGGAFLLGSGAATLAYQVQWNASAGQTSGTALSAGTKLGGLTSTATQQICSSGPAASASLIVVIPTTALGAAAGGIGYSGTLTLVIGVE
jgi:hypothetical protein